MDGIFLEVELPLNGAEQLLVACLRGNELKSFIKLNNQFHFSVTK